MIKIITGWSNRGGSTFAFINLTNKLNEYGYETILYGPHEWHLDKCKSDLSKNFKPEKDDYLIVHFLQLPERPKCKKVILNCHEKNIFEISKINPFWDKVVFINEKQRKYHTSFKGRYECIPNIKETLLKNEKGEDTLKVAGVVGSIDENKQTHISIKRALSDGYEKIYLFGNVTDPNYYNNEVKPYLSDKVIEYGFIGDKQKMYDMVNAVYLSSKSEVASLVKDECHTTGTLFKGNFATTHDSEELDNDEIIDSWLDILEL